MVMKKKKEYDHRNGRLDVRRINEAEIGSYILSEKEIQFRRIMWDLLHKDDSSGDRSKMKKQKKIAAPANRADKVADSYLKDDETNHPTAKRSTKINYDALHKIMAEMDDRIDRCNDGSDDAVSASGDQNIDPNFDFDF